MSKKYNEIEEWNKWKSSGFKNKKHFRNLLKEVDPIVQNYVNKWAPPTIPRSAVESRARNIVIDALPEYDPSKGAKMNTFLTNKLKKLSRYVYSNQNLVSIPENRVMMIDSFKKSKAILMDRLRREPNAAEIADEMHIPVVEVRRLEKELSKNVITNDLINTHMGNTAYTEDDDIIEFIYYELTPEEKLVYEYSLGKNGKPMLQGKDIAKRMRTSTAKVSRLRKSIEKKILKYKGMSA